MTESMKPDYFQSGSTTSDTSGGEDPEGEVLFLDHDYTPPVAITRDILLRAALTEKQERAYVLYARDGLTSIQISKRTGVTNGAVTSILPTAKSKVRNHLRSLGLVCDAVPTPVHRKKFVQDERAVEDLIRYGLGRLVKE